MAFNIAKLAGNALLNGLSGNLNEVSVESLKGEFGAYLMEGEVIQTGFKLVRDVVIITDLRIIDFDKQGATGSKQRVQSIRLDAIVEVTAETAGFGLDDSELTITYITSPYYRANDIHVANKKFEFPKAYNIQGLYKTIVTIAESNVTKLNT